MKNFTPIVLYEDNHLLIVDKPAGMLVQGDQTRDTPLVDHCKEYIKKKYDKPGAVFLGVIHRLDRPVSGVVAFARTSKALERMNKLFKDRKVNKTYWAIVKDRPKKREMKLVNYLIKDGSKNTVEAHRIPVEGGLKAELNFKSLGYLNEHYMLEVKPITGRPHQIRVQLADMGCPIRGDLKYGFPRPNTDKSICLHSRKLEFIHPIKNEPVMAIAGVPRNDFWEQFLVLDNQKVNDKKLGYMQ